MKNVWSPALLLGVVSWFAFSCSSDNDPEPPATKPAEKEVQEIVKELEKVPEVSLFTEELKKLDVGDVESGALTVFAVRNDAFGRASAEVPVTKAAAGSREIERHVVKGAYERNDLTDSLLLKSISGESLRVTCRGDEVMINGIPVETNGMRVGNSVIFEVPEMIPSLDEPDEPIEQSFVTYVQVYLCNADWSPENPDEGYPLAGAKVEFYDYRRNSEGEPVEPGELLFSNLTDEKGRVHYLHSEQELAFKAYLGDSLTNLSDGYVVEGVFTSQAEIDGWAYYAAYTPVPGDLKFQDINADGKIDANDRVKEAPARPIAYKVSAQDTAYSKEYRIYLVPATASTNWNAYVEEAIESFENGFYEYMQFYRKADYDLTAGATDAVYASKQLAELSGKIWNGAYSLIRKQMDANLKLTSDECPASVKRRWKESYPQIQVETAVLFSWLIDMYGGAYLPWAAGSPYESWGIEAVVHYLRQLESELPQSMGGLAVCAAEARLLLNCGINDAAPLQDAEARCQKVIDNGAYQLLDQAEYVFVTASNAEVVWGGYPEPAVESSLRKGAYFHPLRYAEVLLTAADAALRLGKNAPAHDLVNQLRGRDGLEPVGSDTETVRAAMLQLWQSLLADEGLNYAMLRRSGAFKEYLHNKGVTSVADYHSLLPVPPTVITAAGGVIPQNPGY